MRLKKAEKMATVTFSTEVLALDGEITYTSFLTCGTPRARPW